MRIFKAVRSVFPAEKPVWIRISASDFVDGGLTEEDIAFYCKALEEAGCAAIHVSAGGISPNQKVFFFFFFLEKIVFNFFFLFQPSIDSFESI